jgi:hypothetical protein
MLRCRMLRHEHTALNGNVTQWGWFLQRTAVMYVLTHGDETYVYHTCPVLSQQKCVDWILTNYHRQNVSYTYIGRFMALWMANVVTEAASTLNRRLVVAEGREGIARRVRCQSSVFELHPSRQATIWRRSDGTLSSTAKYLIGLGLSKVKCTALYGKVLNVQFTPLKNGYSKCLQWHCALKAYLYLDTFTCHDDVRYALEQFWWPVLHKVAALPPFDYRLAADGVINMDGKHMREYFFRSLDSIGLSIVPPSISPPYVRFVHGPGLNFPSLWPVCP